MASPTANSCRCDVAGCTKAFNRRPDLQRHQEDNHQPPKICPLGCGYEVKRKKRLNEHLETQHGFSREAILKSAEEVYYHPSQLYWNSDSNLNQEALEDYHIEEHQFTPTSINMHLESSFSPPYIPIVEVSTSATSGGKVSQSIFAPAEEQINAQNLQFEIALDLQPNIPFEHQYAHPLAQSSDEYSPHITTFDYNLLDGMPTNGRVLVEIQNQTLHQTTPQIENDSVDPDFRDADHPGETRHFYP